jgi:hypothetical protein
MRFAIGKPPMSETVTVSTGTVTFLFTDIEDGGSEAAGQGPGTRLWEEQTEAMHRDLAHHDALLLSADGALIRAESAAEVAGAPCG